MCGYRIPLPEKSDPRRTIMISYIPYYFLTRTRSQYSILIKEKFVLGAGNEIFAIHTYKEDFVILWSILHLSSSMPTDRTRGVK